MSETTKPEMALSRRLLWNRIVQKVKVESHRPNGTVESHPPATSMLGVEETPLLRAPRCRSGKRTINLMALSKKQIKQLRALANHLNPLIIVGKNDLSDAAYAQADETLEKHELVKCTVLDGSGLDAKDAAQHLADRLRAQVVQVIGNRCVIYRETHDEKVTKIRLVRE